jgi:hypothetical protein
VLQNYIEVYDIGSDAFQLKNIARSIDPKLLMEFNKKLLQLSVCSGSSCHRRVSGVARKLDWERTNNIES